VQVLLISLPKWGKNWGNSSRFCSSACPSGATFGVILSIEKDLPVGRSLDKLDYYQIPATIRMMIETKVIIIAPTRIVAMSFVTNEFLVIFI